MLFLSYFELNQEFDPSEMADVAQVLISKKLYPTEGVKQISFIMSATDLWGISIDEADSEEALARNTNMWRIAKPGFIKYIKMTPALDVAKMIPAMIKLKKQIKQ